MKVSASRAQDRRTTPQSASPSRALLQGRPLLRIGAPDDDYEREADRVASAVVSGARLPHGEFSLSRIPVTQLQREGGEAPSEEEKYKEAAKRIGEGFLETPLGKKLKQKVEQAPPVKGAKEFAGTLHGKVIIGSAAAGVVAALAATESELPMQIPGIPLDTLTPGLKVKITYEGPVNNPTKTMITFSYTEQVKASGKPAQTRAEKQRAESARMAAELNHFRQSLQYPPGSPQALQRQAEEEAVRSFVVGNMGTLPGASETHLYPGLPRQPPTFRLQLPRVWKPRPISLLDEELKLRPLGEVPGAQAQQKKEKEEGGPPLQRRASGDHSPDIAPAAVHHGLESSGSPLEPGLRSFMESRFAHSFEHVRIHTDATASDAARAVHARAFTVERDIVFANGQYAPHTRQGRELVAHELAHVVQQRTAGVSVVQRDVVDDVREKLSYGLFDWAITDTEAIDSLALLSTIPPAGLPAALSRLGTKFVSRLLDNLPDAAKSGEVYQRLIVALGGAGTMDYATGQLSYGIFDWGVTSAEVARVFNLFANLPVAEQEKFLIGLDKSGKFGRLLANSSIGHYTMHLVPWMKRLTRGRFTAAQRSIMRTIVQKAPTSPIDILRLATELRFDVTVGLTTIPGRTAVQWEGKRLRDTYLALDHLPEAHVARNKELLRFGQFSQPETKLPDGTTVITAGVYNRGQHELASNVKKRGDIAPTMIHETGHAVDAEMGWSTGPEPAKPNRGGWKEYPSHNTCATEMVGDSNGGIKTKLAAAQRTDVIADMATAMGNRNASTLAANIRSRPWFAGLTAHERSDVLVDRALKAIPIGLNSPWFTTGDGGEHLGDHVYQESYTPTWVRYRHQARTRMVTKYQFRDAGEWFAECYAAYYDPGTR